MSSVVFVKLKLVHVQLISSARVRLQPGQRAISPISFVECRLIKLIQTVDFNSEIIFIKSFIQVWIWLRRHWLASIPSFKFEVCCALDFNWLLFTFQINYSNWV